MAGEVRKVLSQVPTPARIYDYLLGGKDNFEVDRAAAAKLMAGIGAGHTRNVVWENRKFLGRTVEYLARECGIDQFIDVGAGLPTMRNTHEIAHEANRGARVVYVDNDPMVLSHGRALLVENGATTVVTADMRQPDAILDHPDTKALIDFTRPVAVLFVAVFHFVPSPGQPRYQAGDADPGAIVAAFRDRLARGSYAVVSHLTREGPPAENSTLAEEIYESATAPMILRTRSDVAALFRGWRLVPPGLVRPWQWHSGPNEAPRTSSLWAGVGVKEDEARAPASPS
jgi:hypothetical protein